MLRNLHPGLSGLLNETVNRSVVLRISNMTIAAEVTERANAAPRERYRHFSVSPLLGGIEQLQAEYEHHRFAPHAQETAVIGVVLNGEAVVHGAGCTLSIRSGDVLVIPPRILHDAHSLGSEPWQYRALYLTTAQIEAISPMEENGQGVLADRPFVMHDDDLLDRVVEVQSVLSDEGMVPCEAISSLRSLLSQVRIGAARQLGSGLADRRVAAGISRVRRHIDDNPLERSSLADLARLAGLSRFTFAHAFTRAFGVSPHAYALQRKVVAARALIQEGESVSRVAHRTGFADQAHLTRRFLSVVGVTPGEFRRAWHGPRHFGRTA
jgi:AraC-like DNA-binding protein/mannose-6-phosphate isomerase-like protein (cupin superfamily)